MQRKLILSLALILVCCSTAWSQYVNMVVTSPTDGNGVGTLRYAVKFANKNPSLPIRILFASNLNGTAIELTQGRIIINRNLEIVGNGCQNTILTGNGISEGFEVANHANVTFSNLKMIPF